MFLGEWLNGRVAVSKTVGCVFESRLPCQKNQTEFRFGFFVWSAIRTKTASEREHYIIISFGVCKANYATVYGCPKEYRVSPAKKTKPSFGLVFFVWSAIRTKTASEREHYIIDFKNLAFVLFKVSHY